jgi:Zn-finger nucleic acid-binding protein
LACPKCNGVMHPVNYSYSSGIIIDRCADHGIWLDRGELDKVQLSRETWAKKALESKDHWEEMVSKVAAEQKVIDPSEGISNFSIINRIIHFINNNT